MSKNTLFTGSGVAIVTPFRGQEIDFDAFGSIIDYQIENKTDAIIVCGTTGEASTMPDAEHMDAIRFTVERTAGRIPVIAGTGSNDTRHCVELSTDAKKAGADGLLLVTPYYNKTTQRGLIAHFKAVTDAVDLPIILYNIPGRTGMQIDIATLKELSKIDNIVAVKEASGNISYAAEVAAECPDLDIYSGNDDMIVPIMSLGGKGVISVLANILPKETHELCDAYLTGNTTKACEMQLHYLKLIKALFMEVNPIPVKTAMNLMGMNAGNLRLPLSEMEGANLEKLKAAMSQYGLL